jgi:putative NADH-flavin reductase
MKIALIGATGFVGSKILGELLSRGHKVTAIARNTSNIESAQGLTTASADVADTEALTGIIEGNNLVISSYNAGWSNPNMYEDFLKGSQAIQQAVKKAKVERLIVIGGAGSLYVDGKQLVDSPDFPAAIKPGAAAARDYLNILKEEKEIDWTFFSPAIEMHQGITTGKTGHYRLGEDEPVFDENGRSVLSAEDLAVAIADEAEQHRYSHKRFTAAY